MTKIIVFGIEKLAEIAYVYITNDSEYEIVAFTVDREYLTKKELFNLPVLPFEEIEKSYPPKDYKMFIAIGYQDLNRIREKKYYEAKEKGYELISYVSSNVSNIGKSKVGDNCFILEFNVIQPFVKIGNNVIIFSANYIGHGSKIGDHCFIGSHVVITGENIVKQNCFIGVNSTIANSITIEKENFIGSGCMITQNTEEKGVYVTEDTKKFRLNSDFFLKFTKMK